MFKNFMKWLQGSADNKPGGASSKKLSAFWTLVILISPVVWTWTYWAYKNNDWSMLVPVLTILFASVGSFLAINMYEKIKGKASTPEELPPS